MGRDMGRFGQMLFREQPTTPAERDQFYDVVIQRFLERGTRQYELNDQQRQQVQARLEQLKAEQRQFAEPRMQEFETLRRQMREAFIQSQETGQLDRQRMQQLGEQMRAFWQGSPLLDRERVTDRIEQILPPEQVERGRARRAEEDAAWQQERAQRMRRVEEMIQQGQDPFQGGAGPEGQSPDDRRQRRFRGERPEAGRPAGELRGSESGRDRDREGRDGRERRESDNAQQVVPNPEDALGSWERYVRDFIRRYQLDASQQATAQSVLREAQEQRTLYENTKRGDFQAARQIADAGLRQQQLDALNEPVKRMFEGLKMQMERIPTFAQRQAVETAPPATQPTASTRPSATTRPAGFDRERRRPSGDFERRGRFGESGRSRDRGGRSE